MSNRVAPKNATEPFYLLWLEAAYVYYLHPENDPVLSDAEWDNLGNRLATSGCIEDSKSLFHLKEEDYPLIIRQKYGQC